jgi:hypothetical protein
VPATGCVAATDQLANHPSLGVGRAKSTFSSLT